MKMEYYTHTRPYMPQQARVVEMKSYRSMFETGLTQLFHARLPLRYWNDSFQSADFLLNRLPTKVLAENKSPYELLFSKQPEYTFLGHLGATVILVCHYPQHKFTPRSVQCVFLGYKTMQKDLDLKIRRMYVSRHNFL